MTQITEMKNTKHFDNAVVIFSNLKVSKGIIGSNRGEEVEIRDRDKIGI